MMNLTIVLAPFSRRCILSTISVTLLAACCASSARSDVIYNNGMVNDLASYQAGNAQVINGPGGATTTLNVLPGGEIQFDLLADQDSVANVTGGVIGDDLTATGFSLVTVSGGQIGAGPNALGNGNVIVLGDFNFAYGDYDADSSLSGQFLIGTLADGAMISNQIFIYDNGIVTLAPPPAATPVPEPNMLAICSLVGLFGAGCRWRRRRRSPVNC